MKSLLVIFLILIGGTVQAATETIIATGSTIDEIGSNTGNEKNFFIYLSGGTKTCSLILFPLSAAGEDGGDEALHARAYSAALTAFTTGSKVVVTNYVDSGCKDASKIKLTK